MKEVSPKEARLALKLLKPADSKTPMHAERAVEVLEEFINQVEDKSLRGKAKRLWLRFTTIQAKSP